MAAFATMADAEARVRAKGPAGDRTWVVAHSERNANGVIMVRFIRWMGPGAALLNGGWVETNDDSVV